MIILGGIIESMELSMDLAYAVGDKESGFNTMGDLSVANKVWPSVRRSSGGHRIATYLREQGYDVEVVDFWPAWSRIQLLKFFHQRVREDTLCVGLSGMFSINALQSSKDGEAKGLLKYMVQTLLILKERYPNLPFVGGAMNISAISAYPLDYFVSGFGEKAIIELLKYFKREFNTLKVTTKHMNGGVQNFIDAQNDYPAHPMPDARVKYEERDFIQPGEVLTIELARGCKFKCKFCQFPILGVRGDYARSADSLREELLDNYNRWGTRVYQVSDDTINDSPEKLARIAGVVRELPFQPHFAGFMRGDLLVNHPETWQDIYDMGLRSQLYGLETLHQPAGKIIGKGINVEKLKEGMIAVRNFFENKEEGRGDFRLTISTILGLPNESKETYMAGIDWLQNTYKVHAFNTCPLYVVGPELRKQIQTPSEFDLTWEEEGWFEQMDVSQIDQDSLNFHPATKDWMMEQLFHSNRLKWKHDTMDFVEALHIFNDILIDKSWAPRCPDIFDYHRYLTIGKYTIEDIYTKEFGPTENDIEPFNQNDLDDHMQFIQDYIQKKLAYGETA